MTKPTKTTAAKAAKTPAPAEKKIDVSKISDVAKKIPAFLKRMKVELEKLIALIDKAEAAVNAFSSFKFLTREQKTQKKLLERQVKAMKAYRDALQARVANEEAAL